MPGVALAVGVLAVTATLAVGYAAAGAASVEAVRLSGVADAVALAAADTVSGAIPGIPCERAAQMAAHGGAHLDSCAVDGAVATVAVSARHGLFVMRARARAGPPP